MVYKPRERRTGKPRYEKIIIGQADVERRKNLLINAECGLGKVKQMGKHLSYTVGNDDFGYVEYFILDTSLPTIIVFKDETK